MFVGTASWDFPKLSTYSEANEYFVNQKEYTKGKNKGLKPLRISHAGRRTPHYRIAKLQDGSIAIQLYDTNVVKFDKDGDIFISSSGYETPMTGSLINRILGDLPLFVGSAGGFWCLYYHNRYTKKNEYQTRTGKHRYDFHLRYSKSHNRLEVVNPHEWLRQYVRLGKMREVRKKYAKPIKYLVNMAKVQDAERVRKEANSAKRLSSLEAINCLNSEDINDWWTVAQAIYQESFCVSWKYGEGYVTKLTVKSVKDKITSMLKTFFAEEILEYRVRPAHMIPKPEDITR